MLGLAAGLQKGGSALLNYVTDNLKLYLDFKKGKHDTLKFPCEGSTDFSGSGQYINCGTAIGTSLGDSYAGDISVAFWVNPDTITSNDGVFAITDRPGGGTNDPLHFWIESSNLNAYVGATSVTSIPINTWTHFALCFDSTANMQYLYKNGVLADSDANTSAVDFADTTTYIGRYWSTNDMDGSICNVGLWTRPLSAEEVNSVMRKNYSQLKSVEKTSLVSWWALDSVEDTNTDNTFKDEHTAETLGSEQLPSDFGDSLHDPADATLTVDASTNTFSYVPLDSSVGITNYLGSGGGQMLLDANLAVGTHKITFNASWTNAPENKYIRVYHTGSTSTHWNMVSGENVYYAYISAVSVNTQIYISFNNTNQDITISNLSIKQVTSGMATNAGTTNAYTGATTTTSVYGGNAPVLPRSVDVAREGEAEKIGNGSAVFDGSSRINFGDALGDLIGDDYDKGLTIAFWFKPDVTNGDDGLLTWGGFSNDNGDVQITLGSDAINFLTTSEGNVESTIAHTDKGWNYYTGVFDGANNIQKLYINGILQDSDSNSNKLDLANKVLRLGVYYSSAYGFDGNIAQFGIWLGALTQAQIQSVMESTSYATIPASVKSTLSAEETSLPFANSGSYAYTTFSATSTGFTASDSSGANDVVTARMWTGDNSGKLYKITFDLTINSGATPSLYWSPDVAGGNGSGQTAMSAGSNTIYKTNTGSTYDWLLFNTSGAADYEVSNFSVKEVTNDLVGYWGLDADNSANGATQDSTTGETTTSVYNRDFAGVAHGSDPTALSYIYAYGSPGEKVIDTERIKIVDSSNTGVYWNESGLTASKLYKVTIDATGDVHSDGVYSGTISFTLSDGTFTGYKTGITTTGAIYLRAGNNTIPGTTYYDNLKVEEVTSNTGVLL